MNSDNTQQIITVLSPGRSGTSLLMSILGRLGMSLSPDMIPGSLGNPDGFLEDQEIVNVQKGLMQDLNLTPRLPLTGDWLHEDSVKKAEVRLKEILRARLAESNGVWGFKDPRTAVFLPLWRKIFNSPGMVPRFILAIRDPVSVVVSLKRQVNQPQSYSELQWLLRATDALYHTSGDCYILHYEDWFTKPEILVSELAEFTGLSDLRDGDKRIQDACSMIKPGLNRSQYDECSLKNEYVGRFYQILTECRGHNFDRGRLMEAVKDCRKAMEGFMGWPLELCSVLKQKDDLLGKMTGHAEVLEKRKETIENLRESLSGKTETITELRSKLSGKNETIAELQSKLSGKNEAITELRNKLSGKNETIAELQGKLSGKNEAITELRSKLSGKNETIAELQSKLSGKTETITELRNKLAGKNETIAELKADQQRQNNEVRDLKSRLGRQTETIQNLKSELSEKRVTLERLKNGMDDQELKLNEFRLEKDRVSEIIEKINLQNNAYLQEIKVLQQELFSSEIRGKELKIQLRKQKNLKQAPRDNAEIVEYKKQNRVLNRKLATCQRGKNRLAWLEKKIGIMESSYSFRLGRTMIDAIGKPGKNTVLMPFRVMRLMSEYLVSGSIRKE